MLSRMITNKLYSHTNSQLDDRGGNGKWFRKLVLEHDRCANEKLSMLGKRASGSTVGDATRWLVS